MITRDIKLQDFNSSILLIGEKKNATYTMRINLA